MHVVHGRAVLHPDGDRRQRDTGAHGGRLHRRRLRFCLSQAVADYAPWQRTRIVYPFNPYRITTGGPGNPAFTKSVMQACRADIGARCVLDNHDLNNPLTSSIVPIYSEMKQLGPEIEFQTFNETPADFPGTIKLGVSYGASGIELWQDFKGFPLVPAATLKQWAAMIEGQ